MKLTLFVLFASFAFAQSIPATSDEWVGPLAGWKNVTTSPCSATGNGSTDDTTAIQTCLNLFTVGNDVSPTLYFPAGTYKITSVLTIAHRINIQVIGHSNSDTTITWAGAGGGTMLDLNGVAYSKFSRLTLNGASTSGFCVDQSWDGTGNYFDSGNEFSDIVFDHCGTAYRCGFLDFGCAETSMLRDQFLHATFAVRMYNFNALDLWIWYSTFDTCTAGITNWQGAGNFHVYNSNFLNTGGADLYMGNTGGFSARNNYSSGANRFWDSGATANPGTIIVQGNTVLDTKDDTSVSLANEGPHLFMDNVYRSRVGFTGGPVVYSQSSLDATSTLIGNTYGNTNTTAQNEALQVTIGFDENTVARSTINPSQPTLPPELPNLGRTITEVSSGANTAAIQSAINTACVSNGTRPVVHIPFGFYSISTTLTVPICDVQIIGDGMGDVQGTILNWTGSGSGPVISIAGPSRATFRDLEVNGNGTADGIVVNNADQIGARVYADQILLAAGAANNVNVNGLDNTFLEFENYGQTGQVSKCTGGPNKQSGSTAGRWDIFSGASSGAGSQFDASSGCTLLVRDLWYESNFVPGFANIHGKATFTLDGGLVSTGGSPQPFIITDLNGLATVTEITLDQGFTISGNGTNAKVLGLGCNSHITNSTSYFTDTTSPAGTDMLLNCRNAVSPNVGYATSPTTNVGTATEPFLATMLAQTRTEAPAVLTAHGRQVLPGARLQRSK